MFKTFLENDIVSTRTLLHEAIPITGSIVSGTYVESGQDPDVETNIKNYSHGLFQSVYDYPYLSSSANHIFDITIGYSAESPLSGAITTADPRPQQQDKINLYNQMAQVLVGHDKDGNIRMFDRDGDLADPVEDTINKMDSVFFMNFTRLLVKDEIKKGSFKLQVITGSAREGLDDDQGGSRTWSEGEAPTTKNDPAASRKHFALTSGSATGFLLTLQDHDGNSSYLTNSPAGEYGVLYTGSGDAGSSNKGVGLVYYQAGIAVITSSIFRNNNHFDSRYSELLVDDDGSNQIVTSYGTSNDGATTRTGGTQYEDGGHFGWLPGHVHGTDTLQTGSVEACFVSASISASCGGLRNALYNVEFNNTTELNSTIYFVRAGHNEFNYSSNPSYIGKTGADKGKIFVKDSTLDQPVTYITSIGLYSANNELLAVAKLSEPIKKTPDTELTFRVRLDY